MPNIGQMLYSGASLHPQYLQIIAMLSKSLDFSGTRETFINMVTGKTGKYEFRHVNRQKEHGL